MLAPEICGCVQGGRRAVWRVLLTLPALSALDGILTARFLHTTLAGRAQNGLKSYCRERRIEADKHQNDYETLGGNYETNFSPTTAGNKKNVRFWVGFGLYVKTL